jgi:hypothetical protein
MIVRPLLSLGWRALVAIAALGSLYWVLEDHGVTSGLWRNWWWFVAAPTGVLLIAFLVMTTFIWCWKDDLDDLSSEHELAGLVVLCGAVASAFKMQALVGSIAVGAVAATVWTAIRTARWMGGWRDEPLGTRRSHLRTELARHGRRVWTKPDGRVGPLLSGPVEAEHANAASLSVRAQVAGGAVAIVLTWSIVAVFAGSVAWGATAAHHIAHFAGQRHTASRVSGGSTTTTTMPLTCRGAIGEGPDVPPDVTGAALRSARQAQELGLDPCSTASMEYRDREGAYVQSVFGTDGVGVVVVWDNNGRWESALLSGDDVRGYRRVRHGSSWSDLGRPLPFFRCDGLWIQPIQSDSGVLAGLGIRSTSDRPSKGDEPIFMWGSDAEAILGRPDGHLALPAGQPTSDSSGPIQHLYGAPPIRGAQMAASGLTADQLLARCD